MATNEASVDAPDRLLRIDEVRSLIPISKAGWYRRVAAGEAPKPVKLGRATLWRASEIAAWMAGLR